MITSNWIYSSFSSYCGFRLELFGNIWPWWAQWGTVGHHYGFDSFL